MPAKKRAVMYLDVDLHKALRRESAATDQTVSELVNGIVRAQLADALDDLATPRRPASDLKVSFRGGARSKKRRRA